MQNYPVVIEQERDGYVVYCPAFAGCYSQGDTIEEALENIKEAISLCLEEQERPLTSIIVGNVAVESQ